MPDPGRRFTFQPLERRGLLLGLDGGQIGTLLGGIVAALVAGRTLGSPAGPGVAIALVALSAAAALWPLSGRPLGGWIPVVLAWVRRGVRGPLVDAEPLAGRRASDEAHFSGCAVTGDSDPRRLSPRIRPSGSRTAPAGRGLAPAGIDLFQVADGPDGGEVGVIRDRRSGLLATVVPVEGQPFVLLDLDEQLRRMEVWRAALAILARPGTPIRRIQWVHRSATVFGNGLIAAAATLPSGPSLSGPAQESYRQMVDDLAPATQDHRAWVVLAVGAPCALGSSGRAMQGLRREMRLLAGHLRNGNLDAGGPLGLAPLRDLLGSAHRSRVSEGGDSPPARPWSMAADEGWAAFRADGTWHTTYWISEWPRVEVNPDFLTPLLLCDGRRTVSVVMAPVPAARAAREARAARAADVADEELRSRAGFLPSARRGRESEGVLRRETELADGHAEYRFSGYITVSATERDSLRAACAETEQAAQRAHLELQLLYGRQAEAYTWTLPLARGLV